MYRHPLRFAALALATAAAAGCAMNDSRDDTAKVSQRDETTTVVHRESTHVTRSDGKVVPSTELVGVPACDDFLASYRACHAVIGAYAPDVLEKRYAEMRSTLVSQAHDPEMAGTLEARCNGMIAQRDEALAGRACLPSEEAPVATTNDDDDLFDDGK